MTLMTFTPLRNGYFKKVVDKEPKGVDNSNMKKTGFFNINIRGMRKCISICINDWFTLEFVFMYSVSMM